MAGANEVMTERMIGVAEEVHNNLVKARFHAERLESGLVKGYDDLSGRLLIAEGLVNDGISFPELAWRIREAKMFLGDVPDGSMAVETE